MKVTYLNHSGFLVEWEHCFWLFDYYKGNIPELDRTKHIFVFCSHSHGDHFNPAVFALAMEYPSVTYVFSNQVRRAYRKLQRDPRGIRLSQAQYGRVCGMENECGEVQIPDDTEAAEKGTVTVPIPEVLFLPVRTDTVLRDGSGNDISVHTLQSTDCGCAFVVRYMGKTVYHAGDLHWWSWPGESEAWNRKMTSDYQKEIQYLENQNIDLAFTPLDPRQESAYACGMNYLLKKVRIRDVFPMHFWDSFDVIDRYLRENSVPEGTTLHRLVRDGQSVSVAED